MKTTLLLFGSLLILFQSLSQRKLNETYNYTELIAKYEHLANEHKEIHLFNMGSSDYGLPIYLCLINIGKDSSEVFSNAKNGTTILINNAIHAGEPDGVDASLNWIEKWIKDGKNTKNIPVVAIIPAYNVGGMMNRSSSSRANQNGPKDYGFRGNANNLDLNRDFMKMDSKNAMTFARIFHALDPDIFVDTHVSNGADYQYTLTLISSMPERMVESTRTMTEKIFLPQLKTRLKDRQIDLMQYVELKAEIPDSGLVGFNDLPRYANGYAALFNTLSFTIETHMLKDYESRVKATESCLDEMINMTSKLSQEIEAAKKTAIQESMNRKKYAINYELSEKYDLIKFKGFESAYKPSQVSGYDRLYYDRLKPFEKEIRNYHYFETSDSIQIPRYYIVGSQCEEVIKRLEANHVKYQIMAHDTVFSVTVQKILSYNTVKSPYEGHYLHTEIKTEEIERKINFKKGDLIINSDQIGINYLINALEARAEDGFFAWNFFDSYLQQKEHFSPYVFEDLAFQLLENDQDLKKAFENVKKEDASLSKSAYLQLKWIYDHSAYKEKYFNILPVYKVY